MNPLAFHILARLQPSPAPASVDQKAEFGRYVNEAPDFARSQYMPDLVTDHLPEVVRYEFSLDPPATPDDVDPIRQREYKEFWADHVASEPWDIYTISKDMADRFGFNEGWAFKTARQHLNQLVLQARMRGYREEEPLAGRRFRWAGPEADHPACQWIREQVPPEGLPYHKLVDLMGEAKRRFVEDPPATAHVVHDWCRHEIREVQ